MDVARSPVLAESAEALSNEQLLAAVVAPAEPVEATAEAVGRLLRRGGGLRRLLRMTPRELSRELDVAGVDDVSGVDGGVRLACALELGRRAIREDLPRGRIVHAARDLEPLLRGHFEGRTKEVFVVVLLDAKQRAFRTERVSEGCLTWSVVHPREVYGPAVREGAGAIIVAHNHPSGDPSPSTQDVDLTTRLVRVGDVLGIPLLDHVVVGRCCLSMRAEGLMAGAARWT